MVTAVLLAWLLGTYGPPPEVEVPELPAEFDGRRAYGLMRELALGYPNRVTGTPEDEAAAAWVAAQLRGLGLEVVEQRFEVWNLDVFDTRTPRFKGINVLGISPGSSERAIVIGSHRDIVSETTQGAVDNASGNGTMLELARVLTAAPHRYTYVFASWGAEEIGLGGSRYYVGHPVRPTALALSVDVTGLVQRDELMLVDWASLPLEAALAVERMALAQGLISAPRARNLLDLAGLALTSGAATDSTPFALQGIPALGIGWETPHFEIIHTQRDTVEQVDAESLELTGRLAERLVRLAERRDQAFLATPPLYLRREDGWIVAEWRVGAALGVVLLFALSQPALAWWRARPLGAAPGPGTRRTLGLLVGLAAACALATAGLPWPLGLWQGPSWWLPGWLAAVGGLAVAMGAIARRAPCLPPPARRIALSGLLAGGLLALSCLGNPFLMASLLAYPLLALPRLTYRRGWWRALDGLLLLPWLALALGLLFAAQLYGSLLPEYAPVWRVAAFEAVVALTLYASVGLALAPRTEAQRTA